MKECLVAAYLCLVVVRSQGLEGRQVVREELGEGVSLGPSARGHWGYNAHRKSNRLRSLLGYIRS